MSTNSAFLHFEGRTFFLVIFKYVVVDFRHSAPNFRKIRDPETASHKHSIKDPIHVYEELS